jgi:hypothetical protein
MKKLVAVLAFLFCVVASSAFALSKPADWSQSDWEKFIETGVQIGLGEALSKAGSAVPLVDVYSALSAFGSSTKTGLQLWLNRKMQDAEDQNNVALVDRYQAYQSCLNGDCSRLRQQEVSRQSLVGNWKLSNPNGSFEFAITSQDPDGTFTGQIPGHPPSTLTGHVLNDTVKFSGTGSFGHMTFEATLEQGGQMMQGRLNFDQLKYGSSFSAQKMP